MLFNMLLAATAALATPVPRGEDGGLSFEFPMTSDPTKFTIHVDPELVEFARTRAESYRPSYGILDEWTLEGPPATAMTELARYWSEDYEWPKVESHINERDHYGVVIPGAGNYTADIPLHFVHQKSENDSAIPVLFLHGWTSTYLEWEKVIDPLNDLFHIVAPDLPGYGFSPAPTEAGMDPRNMAAAFHALMKKLGYARYGVVGTDVGYFVSSWIMNDVPDCIIGHFLDFMLVIPTQDDLDRLAVNQTTPEENAYLGSLDSFETNHSAYSIVQTEKPLAIDLSMADSPVGFAGWVWDLKYAGSDGYPYSMEELITEAFTLWVQAPYSAMRSYVELYKPGEGGIPPTAYDVPTGLVQWGSEDGPFPGLVHFPLAPQSWAERQASNLVYFKRHSFGGHFPAQKHTDLYVAHVRDFFNGL